MPTNNSLNNSSSPFQVNNIKLDTNTISTTNTNGNLSLTPNGSGQVVQEQNISAGTTTLLVSNSNASNTSSDSVLETRCTTAGGNPYVRLNVSGAQAWNLGIRNATSDQFEINTGATFGAGTAVFTSQVTGNITLTPTSGNVRISSGGLTFDGSNILSVYETGTFTPSLRFGGGTTGITYTSRSGNYVRIGNLMFVQINITLSNKGSSTGTADISGITYTPASVSLQYIVCQNQNMTFTGNALYFSPFNQVIQIANTGTNLTNTNFNNNSILYITGCYTLV